MGATRDMAPGRATLISDQAIVPITEEELAMTGVTMQGHRTRAKRTETDPISDVRTTACKTLDADTQLPGRLIVTGTLATAAFIPGRATTGR